MNPEMFAEANNYLVYQNESGEEKFVHALTNGKFTVTRWKPTDEERVMIAQGGSVWLVVAGNGMPPMSVCGFNPIDQGDTVGETEGKDPESTPLNN